MFHHSYFLFPLTPVNNQAILFRKSPFFNELKLINFDRAYFFKNILKPAVKSGPVRPLFLCLNSHGQNVLKTFTIHNGLKSQLTKSRGHNFQLTGGNKHPSPFRGFSYPSRDPSKTQRSPATRTTVFYKTGEVPCSKPEKEEEVIQSRDHPFT